MALTIIDPGIYGVLVPWGFFNSTTMGKELRESSTVTDVDASNQTDSYATGPTFDTAHAIVQKSPYSAAEISIGDNTEGSSSTLTLSPTTLSATGSFDWSQSATDNHTHSITEGEPTSFAVPPGHWIEEVLLLSVKEGKVPYSLDVYIDGAPGNITFTWNNFQGYRDRGGGRRKAAHPGGADRDALEQDRRGAAAAMLAHGALPPHAPARAAGGGWRLIPPDGPKTG